MKARIVIDDVHPRTPTGEYPAKAAVGELVPVTATIFKDGHDSLGARVRWRKAGAKKWESSRLHVVFQDAWAGNLSISAVGMHEFVVDAWLDVYATWRHKVEVKLAAAQNVSVELAEGIAFFKQRANEASDEVTRRKLTGVAQMLGNESLDHTSRLTSATTEETASLVADPGKTDDISTSGVQRLWVDRARAVYGSWYELFPRSFGGLKGATRQLDYVAQMAFDVVYVPPIHPIGTSFRKGKNNTLNPTSDDVGSPWAIGNTDGGHTEIHSDLGTIEDFDEFVARAKELGMEIALDYALQCSPDHPWVKDHPEWFNHRPDGSIAYAENPPKKYQDIYPINFWPDDVADRVALWKACKEVLDYWIEHGVRIFRVDNPHTKPTAFWAWLIPEVQKTHPDVLFLAEAFTRPAVMAKLAEVGFSQSYTYFTWRRNKFELTEYAVEVCLSEKADYMRPNFWPNTPDILSHPLRDAPLSAFKIRLVLASTLVPSYGIYSGYELGENQPMSDTNEEYLNSEKYEIKNRKYDSDTSLAPLITQLNEIRRRHTAFQRLRGIRFHGADNESIICYSRRDPATSDTVIVVVNLDPLHTQECTLNLNLTEIGVGADEQFALLDELTGQSFYWWGAHNYVRLDPDQPAHVLHVRGNQ